MTDQSRLLSRLKNLDPQAVTVIHERYYPEIFRYAVYRLGDSSQAEDIASDVFVRLLEAVEQGRGPNRSLRGWLFRTTSNAVNDAFRSRYRHPTESLKAPQLATAPGPDDHIAHLEQRSDLKRAIADLTVDQQHVIALRFGAGLSLKDTAEAMGKGINAVKSLQFRAVNALRARLTEGAR
jgi:RNA polymerase sigma-70 factor (ECF subfamily)